MHSQASPPRQLQHNN